MAVHLTKIYTRTGDNGTTGLSNFDRVPKDDPRLVAYADCEETNCMIGQVLALGSPNNDVAEVLRRVQNELFDAGADLATPIEDNPQYPPLRILQSYIDQLEHDCDRFNESLGKLDSFILPGGTPTAALIHTARVICRRAERAAWAAVREFPDTTSALPAQYLNRLSDLLFIVGRVENLDANGDSMDVRWVPGSHRQNKTQQS
ncbi:cob(I)yrinic acid a,c-diamide adenosyltransferase [Corynebacterium argentoratense]|uniref:cob(I)yrinic acid a,c-diamide adenosyltransferase n=1 Tax=Corynebacterium argentoratense TaxID=42817 RepID=UPI001F1B9215|nr:cob(I)yrinic acid a,c-diamide adenosyltransferase [Corynebacterium argentoratense]MCF1766281.1 cob(I)yrinic acid a,c-diamide adenosyltransferase [Corynebacterium argentoratense]